MANPDECALGRAEMIHGRCEERGTGELHVLPGSCSPLPVPVTVKLPPVDPPHSSAVPPSVCSLRAAAGVTLLSRAAPTSSIACVCVFLFLGGYSI